MFHCHVLDHEHLGMMGQFRVVENSPRTRATTSHVPLVGCSNRQVAARLGQGRHWQGFPESVVGVPVPV